MKRLFNLFLIENPDVLKSISFGGYIYVRSIHEKFHEWLADKRRKTLHTNDWPNLFMTRKWIEKLQAK